MDLVSVATAQYLLSAVMLAVGYAIVLGVYRVWFGPLSHVPGPKLAALTTWYEGWFDAVKMGQYWREIERLHEIYGPIVRIGPNEVHISDPAYFNELYSMTNRTHKEPWYYSWIDREGSIFGTLDPDLHKLRSAPIKRGLSQASIRRVDHVLKSHFDRFLRIVSDHGKNGKPLSLGDAYRALAIDVVSDISCPKSLFLLDTPDLGHSFHEYIQDLSLITMWARHIPIINRIFNALPRWVFSLMNPMVLNIFDQIQGQKDQVHDIIANEGKMTTGKDFPVIMNEVYKSTDLTPDQKTPKRLFEEMSIVIAAGSETTSHTLLTLTYHVLANPLVHEKLTAELREHFSAEERKTTVLGPKQLEPLPYLSAVISEGLRLATGVSGRLPRVNKEKPAVYTNAATGKSTLIPAGTAVSMSIRDLHYADACFPDPWTFRPERFLVDASAKKFLAPFGKGARSCVGRELAMAELLMATGNLFARFEGLRLCEGVGRESVEMDKDVFSPAPKQGVRGLDVLVEV